MRTSISSNVRENSSEILTADLGCSRNEERNTKTREKLATDVSAYNSRNGIIITSERPKRTEYLILAT